MRRNTAERPADGIRAVVVIDGEQFSASDSGPLVFGRTDAEGIVGLDAADMGISAVAGSVELAWGVWWVVNQSTKRALLIETPAGPGRITLPAGHRHALMHERVDVLVPGAVYTHVVEVSLPAGYSTQLTGAAGRLTTGTLTSAEVSLSERERDALVALCAGYLEPFPYRQEQPRTYAEAAELLGGDWNPDKVRKAIERVKERFATKESVYFEGSRANDELAGHVIAAGMVNGADLARLPGRQTR